MLPPFSFPVRPYPTLLSVYDIASYFTEKIRTVGRELPQAPPYPLPSTMPHTLDSQLFPSRRWMDFDPIYKDNPSTCILGHISCLLKALLFSFSYVIKSFLLTGFFPLAYLPHLKTNSHTTPLSPLVISPFFCSTLYQNVSKSFPNSLSLISSDLTLQGFWPHCSPKHFYQDHQWPPYC